MLNSQITLTLFFLYVVIVSDKFFDIITPRLQKVILNNLYVRHFFIYMNIFLFTFILGWYTEFSIFDAKKGFSERYVNNSDNNNDNKNIEKISDFEIINFTKEAKIVGKYLGYSLMIYLIFLATTKCELEFLMIFLFLIFTSFILFILKTYGKKKTQIGHKKLMLFEFISIKEKNKRIREYLEENEDKSIETKKKAISRIYTEFILTNTENVLFIISLFVLLAGVIHYYKRKQAQYGSNFNYGKFTFGTLKSQN